MFTEQEILELKAIAGIANISIDVILKAEACTQLDEGVKILAIVVRNAGALEWVARVIERINCKANYLPRDMAVGLQRLYEIIRTSPKMHLIEGAAEDLERLVAT